MENCVLAPAGINPAAHPLTSRRVYPGGSPTAPSWTRPLLVIINQLPSGAALATPGLTGT